MDNQWNLSSLFLHAARRCFSPTRVFASGDTVRSKKNLKRKTRLVVDAEKHESSPHLIDIMDRATDGAEGFEKY